MFSNVELFIFRHLKKNKNVKKKKPPFGNEKGCR
jgi:hypothetical protein